MYGCHHIDMVSKTYIKNDKIGLISFAVMADVCSTLLRNILKRRHDRGSNHRFSVEGHNGSYLYNSLLDDMRDCSDRNK